MTAADLSEACRLYLAVVFFASSVGKARAIERFAATLEALAPRCAPWRRAVAVTITSAELAVALALLSGGPVARYGTAAALALLLGFTAALLAALAARRRVSCNCFGAGEHPISGWDVVRNLLLIAAAVTQLLLEPPREDPAASVWWLALGAAGLAFVATTNLHWLARALRRIRGSADAPSSAPLGLSLGIPLGASLGQAVPAFAGRAWGSDRRVAAAELEGQAAVLLFLSDGCPKCHRTLPELVELLPAIRDAGVTLWIIPADPAHDLATLLEGSALLEHALVVEPVVREQLNPRRVAPAYLFFDHHTVALASGLIGDDDWQSFADQMREPEAAG